LPAEDWDVATSASPQDIRRIFRDRRHFSLKHQTVVLVESGNHYEVTTFRGNPPCLDRDLRGRDFTMNAMALDLSTGRIIDPVYGFRDLGRRLVRGVVDPTERFREDPLRLIRAVRFAIQFNFKIDQRTFAAMHDKASTLVTVSRERIRDELVKILLCPRPSRAFRLMLQSGILAEILPELQECNLKREARTPRYTILKHLLETVDRVEPQIRLRLAALFHDAAKPRVRMPTGWAGNPFPGHAEAGAAIAEEVMARLRFSREDIRDVSHLVRHHSIDGRKRWNKAAARRLLVTVGRESIAPLLALRRADLLASGPEPADLSPLQQLVRRLQEVTGASVVGSLSELAVGGNTVMRILGLPPGPRVGEVLEELWNTVLDHPEWNNQETLTRILTRMGRASRPNPYAGASSA
jgi:poly(A) polymerase/tRNA nucleotidyltransferase (CCA-adding enzyme)